MRLALAAAITLTAVPAFASADLPDGTYNCVLDGAAFGSIKIEGDNYSSSKDGATFDEPQMFIVLDGKIQFLGTVGFLDVTGHVYDNAPVRDGGFDLTVLTPDQSGFVTAACDIA
jgi:hypothetical protein